MKIDFQSEEKLLTCRLGKIVKQFPASSIVRNELNRWRALHDPEQVIYAITHDPYHKYPVMPRPFPRGAWNVYRPRKRTGRYLAPFYIPTDAEQYLEVWDLDGNGGYEKVTGKTVLDLGYGLHFSASATTVGCIRIHFWEDLLWLVNVINEELEQGHSVFLEV